ncbi:MAG: hypothetical protein ACI9X4_002207, partial [Glaciecola sp.]
LPPIAFNYRGCNPPCSEMDGRFLAQPSMPDTLLAAHEYSGLIAEGPPPARGVAPKSSVRGLCPLPKSLSGEVVAHVDGGLDLSAAALALSAAAAVHEGADLHVHGVVAEVTGAGVPEDLAGAGAF